MMAQPIPEEVPTQDAVVEYVNLDDLYIDMAYQRPVSRKKVGDIAEHFSERAAGVLLVNIRNDASGTMACMDGGHRKEAAKLKGYTRLRCMIWCGLSIEEEAKIYLACNTARKQPDALELWKARLFLKEEKALDIEAAVKAAGINIAPYSGSGNRKDNFKTVEAIRAVERVYDVNGGGVKGAQAVTFVLSFLHACWPEDGRALHDRMILGFDMFNRTYQGVYNWKNLQVKCQDVSLSVFFRDATAIVMSYDNGHWKAIARMFLRTYNSKRWGANRLEDKF